MQVFNDTTGLMADWFAITLIDWASLSDLDLLVCHAEWMEAAHNPLIQWNNCILFR